MTPQLITGIFCQYLFGGRVLPTYTSPDTHPSAACFQTHPFNTALIAGQDMELLASGVLQLHYTHPTGACFKTDRFNAVLIGGNSRRYERPNMDNPNCRISQAVLARHDIF